MLKILFLLLRSFSLIVFEFVVLVVFIILFLVGNVLILIVLYCNLWLRNIINNYIVVFVVMDFFSVCVLGIFFVSIFIVGRLVFGMFLCWLSGFLVYFLIYFFMIMMILIVVNCYFCVVRF